MSTGNLLGTITIPATASRNNKTTAVPFTIPFGIPYILIVLPTGASGFSIRTGTGSSLTALSTDFNQAGPVSLQVPIDEGTGDEPVLAIYNHNAEANVTVYAADGKLQS